MRMRARLIAAAASTLLGTALLVSVAQAPAMAGNCSHPHGNYDNSGGHITGTDANVRTGPHYPPGLSCASVGLALFGHAAYYDCFTVGDTYNGRSTWTWVTIPAINRSGWVNDYLLSGAGSWVPC